MCACRYRLCSSRLHRLYSRLTKPKSIPIRADPKFNRYVDMQLPHLWYPRARELERSIICHIGPTNSGKTYSALKALASANTGVYCGPLRLLAWEIVERLRAKDIKCDLITGQERDLLDDASHVSCTVEMTDLSRRYDCAVIDEMQIIGDPARGWAWTQAFLGLQSREIHLCGNPSFLPLIQRICQDTKDRLQIIRYDRLSPLTVAHKPLDSFKGVQKGDCVVAFSRRELYRIKGVIEKQNPDMRCCVIYGGLPPFTRREQAKLFNRSHADTDPTIFNQEDSTGCNLRETESPYNDNGDDDYVKGDKVKKKRKMQKKMKASRHLKWTSRNFDVLVATDAIAMGLNLSIRRVIFSTMEKFDGLLNRRLHPAEIKQIAGRAGRYGSVYETGQVLTMHPIDKKYLQAALSAPDDPVQRAGLFPSRCQLELLGAFLDNHISPAQLKIFWLDVLARVHGEGVRREAPFLDTSAFYRTSFVLEYFDSIQNFADNLKEFKTSYKEVSGGGDWSRRAAGNDDDDDELLVPVRLDEDWATEVNAAEDGCAATHPRSYNYDHDDDMDIRSSGRSPLYSGSTKRVFDGPRTPLSVLFSMFRSCVHLGSGDRNEDSNGGVNSREESSDVYFIGDLDEKRQVALALADIPMPFKDQYTFCLAPVSIDNAEVVKAFRSMARQYSRGHEVLLTADRYILSHEMAVTQPPKSVEDLLVLETMHQIFDLYLWLSMRFPLQFTDSEDISRRSSLCASLIDSALRSQRLTSSSTSNRGKKSSRADFDHLFKNDRMQQLAGKRQGRAGSVGVPKDSTRGKRKPRRKSFGGVY